jgi:hypothetical protein
VKVMTVIELMQKYSALTHAPCMFIQFYTSSAEPIVDYQEVLKATPYLTFEDSQVLLDGCAVIVFDTIEEMELIYNRTVGDDGPTQLNPYKGPARVYALTCVNGEFQEENT